MKVDRYLVGAVIAAICILGLAIVVRVWLWHLLGPLSLLIK